MRDLLAREVERLLANHLGDALLEREVGRLLAREVRRALGEQRDEVAAQLADALLRLRAHRMERVEVAERRGGLHLRRDVRRLEPVDLVQRDDDGLPEPEDAPRDEAVAGADVGARVDDEEHGVDVVERRVDRLLHALGERVDRALEAGQVDERELVVGAVRDAEDAATRRVGNGRRDRDLLAAERVDERRLADVRPAGDGDEAAFHGRLPLGHPGPPPTASITRKSVRMGHGTAPKSRRSRARFVPHREVRAVERLGQQLVGRHRHDAAAVAEHDPVDAHLVQPLPAAAARRRGDRGDGEVPGP